MARKKKVTHHKRTTHRRRVGAVHSAGLMHSAEILLGLVAGGVINTGIQRQLHSVNPKIISVVQMVGGMWLTRKASPIIQGFGFGTAGAGAINLTHEMGLLNGVEDMMSGMFGQKDNYFIPEAQGGLDNGRMVNGIDNNIMTSHAHAYASNGRPLGG